MPDITQDMLTRARRVVSDVARHTDLLPASASLFGADRVYIKAENLQRTGSFKLRGAVCRLSRLSGAEKARGVVCASVGNHAQGVALAAGALGVRASVVMPVGAARSKLEAVRAYGGDVVRSGENFLEAMETARVLETEQKMTFIHAYDDPWVIAGQGTVGLEILEDLPACGTVVVPVGGGGLAAGVALAVKNKNPRVRVVGVEPEAVASMQAALRAGHADTVRPRATLADGAAVARAGELTLQICRQYLDDLVTVGEDDIARAVTTLLERMKLLAEGAGALSLAAVLTDRVDLSHGPVAAVLSGGNIDVGTLRSVLTSG